MSVKTTPKGLLAALAALCVVMLQMPAAKAHIATAAAPRAVRVSAPAPHSSSGPRTISITSTESAPFANVPGKTASMTPITGPAGTPITVTGNITGGTVVSVTVTDAAGALVQLGTTTSITTGTTSGFTLAATLPITLSTAATATVTAAAILSAGKTPTETAALPFVPNVPALTIGTPASSNFLPGPPPTGPHGITATLTGTDFAPGVPITETLVYSSSSGVTSTTVLTTVTPISNATSSEGNFSATISITSAVAYSTTAIVSTTSATAPITPSAGNPTFVVEPRPILSTGPTGATLLPGPIGPQFVTGVTNTVNIASSSYVPAVSGTFQPNSPISFMVGLLGGAGSVISPTAPVTTDANGIFTTTLPLSVSVAGTYVITASDLNSANVATTTVSVVTSSVPGPPVSTTYFAEGYTGQGATNFNTTLDLLNPNVSTVFVTDTYILEQGSPDITPTTAAPDVVVVTHTLAALADMSINVASDIASAAVITGPDIGKLVPGTGQKVAIMVQTAGFQGVGPLVGLGGVVRGVAAERIIERTSSSGARLDGDVSLGTTSANTSYYFAEGYTGASFQEYLVLLNPSPTVPATVTVLAVPESAPSLGTPLLSGVALAPMQRLTINVRRLNVLSTVNNNGLIVNSDTNPIVAERVQYFGPGNGSSKPGETIASGLTTAAKQLNYAYSSLTGSPEVAASIPPTAELQQTIDDRPFVTVMNPDIAGQTIAGQSFSAAGPIAHVSIQLRDEDGGLLGSFINDVPAGTRWTLSYNDMTTGPDAIGFPAVPRRGAPLRAAVTSIIVSSSERVVSELAQYFGQGSVTPSGDANSGAPGLALVGAPSGETDVLFPALGVADPASSLPLSNTVFLYNPGVNPVRILGTYFGASGVVAHGVYTVGPDQIQIIGQNTTDSGGTGPTDATGALTSTAAAGPAIPAGTLGAEFSVVQQRGGMASGEPGQVPETFVAAEVTHSADSTNWWGTQGLYPLPVAPSCASSTGQPLPGGCP